MTPIEKAETALNARIARIQANLVETKSDTSRQFLFQSLVACIGIGEALTHYVKAIGDFARERHGVLKQSHAAHTAEHEELLRVGKEQLERFKAAPTDKALRKEIERTQASMAAIQKTLRRGTNALQRELAPSMAMLDEIALTLRRLGEADQKEPLKRAVKRIIEQADELYRAQPTLTAKRIVDAEAWANSAAAEIDRAPEYYEAYAHAGTQAMLALDVMALALSTTPPTTAEDATRRASESVSARIKEITGRFTTGGPEAPQ